MKLCSVTLAHSTEGIIGDALKSVVGWVDACVVMDTGITDGTLDVAKAICGDKLVVKKGYGVATTGVTRARNDLLAIAHELGFDWAVMLDTDERIQTRGLDVRRTLEETDYDVLSVDEITGVYCKERFFKLPANGTYTGVVHENWEHAEGKSALLLPMIAFEELKKTPEQYRKRAEFIVGVLEKQVPEEPKNSRWRYYFGESLQQLGRHEEAIEHFVECYRLNGKDEEACLAAVQAALSMTHLGRFEEASQLCASAMALHPGIAELPMAAAYAEYLAKNWRKAVYWATLATAWGAWSGNYPWTKRTYFKHLPSLYEKPFEVLCECFKALGETAQARSAAVVAHQAKEARLARYPE